MTWLASLDVGATGATTPFRKWAIVFDLDDTLILTAALEQLRASRNWKTLYAVLHKTSLPPGTRAFLQEARALAKIGVVTNSPRPYAERLLAYHRIALPVTVAYHDTLHRKPHPEGLKKAAAILAAPCNCCIYIGNHPDDHAAALRAGYAFIGVSWSLNHQAPGELGLCRSWTAVLQKIRALLAQA